MTAVLAPPDEVLWVCSDPWVNLRPLIVDADVVTVLTVAGALLHVDQSDGTWVRHTAGLALAFDGVHRMYDEVERANPCGLRIVGGHHDDWYESAAIAVVLGGIQDFTHASIVPAVKLAHSGLSLAGHPDGWCGSRGCPNRPS